MHKNIFPIDHHCTTSSMKQNCVYFPHGVLVYTKRTTFRDYHPINVREILIKHHFQTTKRKLNIFNTIKRKVCFFNAHELDQI